MTPYYDYCYRILELCVYYHKVRYWFEKNSAKKLHFIDYVYISRFVFYSVNYLIYIRAIVKTNPNLKDEKYTNPHYNVCLL